MENKYSLPLGAIVIYRNEGNVARMVVVQHSCDCDGSPLYMVAEKPIEPPPSEYRMHSVEYLTYRLFAGWYCGNVELSMLEDTGERVATTPFFDHETGRRLGPLRMPASVPGAS